MNLFDDTREEHLPLPDADLSLWQRLPLPIRPSALLEELIDQTPWRCDSVTVFGKTHQQPRLSAWYGDPEAHYRYSGIALTPLSWTTTLQQIRSAVETASRHTFNSVLLNYYRDHRDGMGMHADDEPELGPRPVIASLSLGEERALVFQHRYRKELKRVRVSLPPGSLLLMRGDTQRCWKHGIDKLRRPCGPRLNLTFRSIRHHHC